jgi:hypothetical protein
MEPADVEQQKAVEFYAASVNAWYNSALEHDKSLFSLSAGGIGLLITLLTTIGIPSWIVLSLYVCALLAFLTCLAAILLVFSNNKKHIEKIITDGPDIHDTLLINLDKISLISFGAGAAFSAIIGISSAVSSFNKQETNMATNGDNKKPAATTTRGIAQDSFQGVANLKKSFTGAGKLQPQPVASAPAPVPVASSQPSASTTGTDKK